MEIIWLNTWLSFASVLMLKAAHRVRYANEPFGIKPSYVMPTIVFTVGLAVGLCVGDQVVPTCVGDRDGASVGLVVGEVLGLAVGASVGLRVGEVDGEEVGLAVGLVDGEEVGLTVGLAVGASDSLQFATPAAPVPAALSKYPVSHLHCCTRVALAGPDECGGHADTALPVL